MYCLIDCSVKRWGEVERNQGLNEIIAPKYQTKTQNKGSSTPSSSCSLFQFFLPPSVHSSNSLLCFLCRSGCLVCGLCTSPRLPPSHTLSLDCPQTPRPTWLQKKKTYPLLSLLSYHLTHHSLSLTVHPPSFQTQCHLFLRHLIAAERWDF